MRVMYWIPDGRYRKLTRFLCPKPRLVRLLCSFRHELKNCLCYVRFSLQVVWLTVCENRYYVDVRSRCRAERVTWSRRLARLGTASGAVSAATFFPSTLALYEESSFFFWILTCAHRHQFSRGTGAKVRTRKKRASSQTQ